MANSQNGWPNIQSTATSLNRSAIPGTSVVPAPGVRAGDVATILHYVGTQFDKRVQKLVKGWCWGWSAPAKLANGDYHNHGSGTAIDFNAPNFPMGRRNMTAAQIAACRAIVKELGGTVRWGGEWAGTNVDQMHFEIYANATAVKAIADKIRKGTLGAHVPPVTNNQGADMIDTSDITQLRAVMRDIKGWSATNVDAGKHDKTEATAWAGKTWEQYIAEAVKDGASYRTKREAALAYYAKKAANDKAKADADAALLAERAKAAALQTTLNKANEQIKALQDSTGSSTGGSSDSYAKDTNEKVNWLVEAWKKLFK